MFCGMQIEQVATVKYIIYVSLKEQNYHVWHNIPSCKVLANRTIFANMKYNLLCICGGKMGTAK